MQRIEGDSCSVSSSKPSAASTNSITKKRGIRRLSLRRLFYSSPLVGRTRRLSKARANVDGNAAAAHNSETSLSAGNADQQRQHKGGSSLIANSKVSKGDGDAHNPLTAKPVVMPGDSYECPLCLTVQPYEAFPHILTCNHRSCFDCLQQYLKIEIAESRVNMCCPECTEPMHPTDIRRILNDEVFMLKYEEFMLRRVLATEPDVRWCPAPDCSFGVIAAGCASCPKIRCERPECQTFFCYHCKQEWHPNQTCDNARAQRSPNVHSSSVSFSQDSAQHDIKPCPSCKVLIVKVDDGSCNHMTCAVCGAEFCWLCMKEISDLHYLSPSGCTFWGKKPWSRKKKILWQLGTLVGAPVGISLVAGIAVPAIIIGIPVWVGRKLHARYVYDSKHRRNLAITGGVTASILISPILAGLAVGIGVPILLAYVYGVVPISLCRSGGCGVTTSASGVRIEFDEENDIAGGPGRQAPDVQSVDMGNQQVANPSIGEMSFGMSASLSMGSGSHLERIGLIRDGDRESVSNTAIAGASLTGSISSSVVGNCSGGHRLEVHADVASNKRFSFSSETASATVSFSERSATSYADDASTKELAGSITGGRDTLPIEVHVGINSLNSHSDMIVSDSVSTDMAMPVVPEADCYLHPATHSSAEESCCRASWRSQHCKQTIAALDKQVYENENGSVWSAEDTVLVSERVRFDDNVSFIDDYHSEESQFGGVTMASSALVSPTSSSSHDHCWRPARRVGSAGPCSRDDVYGRTFGQTESWERAQSWQGVCEQGSYCGWERRSGGRDHGSAGGASTSGGVATISAHVEANGAAAASGCTSSPTTTIDNGGTPLHRSATFTDGAVALSSSSKDNGNGHPSAFRKSLSSSGSAQVVGFIPPTAIAASSLLANTTSSHSLCAAVASTSRASTTDCPLGTDDIEYVEWQESTQKLSNFDASGGYYVYELPESTI